MTDPATTRNLAALDQALATRRDVDSTVPETERVRDAILDVVTARLEES